MKQLSMESRLYWKEEMSQEMLDRLIRLGMNIRHCITVIQSAAYVDPENQRFKKVEKKLINSIWWLSTACYLVTRNIPSQRYRKSEDFQEIFKPIDIMSYHAGKRMGDVRQIVIEIFEEIRLIKRLYQRLTTHSDILTDVCANMTVNVVEALRISEGAVSSK